VRRLRKLMMRIFAPEFLISDDMKLGEMPGIKTAYSSTANLALPAVIEMVFIALIGVINTAMVGNLGSYAIAAVGLVGQPRMLILSIFTAVSIGVTAIVARSKGAENREDANLCLVQALGLSLLLSAVVAFIAHMAAVPLMYLAGAAEDTVGPASSYFRTICLALPFQAFSLTVSAAQRGIGQTKLTLKINLTANIVNIFLNFLLIEGRFGLPRLEVTGSAVGILVGQFCGFILALQSILKKDAYLTLLIKKAGFLKPDLPMLKNIGHISGGAMLEQLAQRFGFIIFARLVADLGTDVFAAHQIGMQMMSITFTFGDGLSVASTALVGQNIGKKRPDLSIVYGKISQRFASCASCVMFSMILGLRHWFVRLFSDDPFILALSASVIAIQAFFQFIQTSQVVMGGSLRGSGDTKFVAATMLFTVGIIRPGISYLLIYPAKMGIYGAWAGMGVDMTLRLVLLMRRFSTGKWMQHAMSR